MCVCLCARVYARALLLAEACMHTHSSVALLISTLRAGAVRPCLRLNGLSSCHAVYVCVCVCVQVLNNTPLSYPADLWALGSLIFQVGAKSHTGASTHTHTHTHTQRERHTHAHLQAHRHKERHTQHTHTQAQSSPSHTPGRILEVCEVEV